MRSTSSWPGAESMGPNIESLVVGERWATFDCYGTLIDWEGGFRSAFRELWPQVDPQRMLEHYHAVEPRVQAERDLPYREVMARSLAAVAAIERVELAEERREVLAESLPRWSAFDEVPAALTELRERGWKLAILSNTDPDLLAASVETLGVPFELLITAAEAGSYKPAPGHWKEFRELAGDVERHVHVGASRFHDVAPAADLGIPMVWVNRLGETSDLPRAAELPDLNGLADAVEEAAGS
jgi:2-haloalkanoic acid dehalogenase type II